MTIEDDIATIARQEKGLRLQRWDEESAWTLGSMLRAWALEHGWPIVIDIRRFDQPMFFAALPGSSPDNVDWARRKGNVVARFHRSSYGIGLGLSRSNATLEAKYGLAARDFAAHGGAFPIAVEGAGVVGSVTVSGLPQREDHRVVVKALCALAGISDAALQLDP